MKNEKRFSDSSKLESLVKANILKAQDSLDVQLSLLNMTEFENSNSSNKLYNLEEKIVFLELDNICKERRIDQLENLLNQKVKFYEEQLLKKNLSQREDVVLSHNRNTSFNDYSFSQEDSLSHNGKNQIINQYSSNNGKNKVIINTSFN